MLKELTDSIQLISQQSRNNIPMLLGMIGTLWSVFILNWIFQNRLVYLGIIPRTLIGLRGVLFSPFLHANFNHLFFNSIPLVVLANFLLIYGVVYFTQISLWLMALSGLLTWLIAKPGIHIGASSIITGYWAILACNAFQHATFISLLLGLISIYYFAGIFLGVFPSGKKGVSWEGHLSGLIAGIIITLYIVPTPIIVNSSYT